MVCHPVLVMISSILSGGGPVVEATGAGSPTSCCLDQASLPVEAAAPVVLEELRDPKGSGVNQCSASLV